MKLIDHFLYSARSNPKKIAIISEKNQITYEDLTQLIHTLDRRLAEIGIKEGDTVAVKTHRAEFEIAMSLLQSYRGLNIIHASPHQIVEAEVEYDYFLITGDSEDIPTHKKIQMKEEWLSGIGAGGMPLMNDASKIFGSSTITSSGSTGKPKFIRSREEQRVSAIEDHNRIPLRSPNETTRMLATLSPTMGWSMSANIRVLLAGGSVITLMDHRDRILQYIDLYAVNWLMTTPVIIKRIMEFEDSWQLISSLETVQIGGAYTGTELLKKFSKKFRGKISVGYGSSEFGGIANAIYDRKTDHPDGYIGDLYRKDIEVAFFDEELNHLPEANEGVVGFKKIGKHHGRSYLGENTGDEKTGFIGDFFFPGDIMRREGIKMFITGRQKNIINLGGNKYSLEVIQRAIEEKLPHLTVACIAMPGEFGLEKLIVFYSSVKTIDLKEINGVFEGSLRGVRAAELLRLEKFPLTDSSKIDTQKLISLYEEGLISYS